MGLLRGRLLHDRAKMTRAMREEPMEAHAATSRESLARSIAREVQARIPVSGPVPGLEETVDTSIREQAARNELALAWIRAAACAALTLVTLISWQRPSLVGAAGVPGSVVGAVATFGLLSLLLLLALRRGLRPPRMRQLVPAFDSLLIGIPVLLLVRSAAASSLGGIAALAAIACALLAFSGAVRLSRSSQRIATTLATATWFLLAWSLGTPPLIALFVAALLVGIGVLANRLGSVVRSIVAQDVADQRLHVMYADARSAIEAREEVLHIVAHDLRNPLSTIGMSAAMLRDLPADDENRMRYLAVIARCGDSMNRIIQDLLDVARMEAGRLHIERETVGVAELLDAVEELMAPIARERGLQLGTEPTADGLRVHADGARIQQVFSNLIGNAIKFTPKGGNISLRAQRLGDRVRFSVLDTGPGVPPERIEQLFERFWQAHDGDRRGIGLGLAIARSIVEAHDGRIGVEQRNGGGSDFWFTIPVAPDVPRATDHTA